MIVERDSVCVTVIDQEAFEIGYGHKEAVNPEGLMRIFEQYVLETYTGGQRVPVGQYRVSRTKWLFRPAVYEVHPIGSR